MCDYITVIHVEQWCRLIGNVSQEHDAAKGVCGGEDDSKSQFEMGKNDVAR